MSTQGHHLSNLGSTLLSDAICQVSNNIGQSVPKKKFLNILPYMDMAAILVMGPGSLDQIVVTPSQGGSILTLIGPVVSEKKTFESMVDDVVGRRRPAYQISSPMSLWGELKMACV